MGFLLWLGGLVGLAGGVWGLFIAADSTIPDSKNTGSIRFVGYLPALNKTVQNLRQDIAEWLNSPQATVNWAETFVRVFDLIFTEKHLSWKCFRRSCIASIISVAASTLLWTMLFYDVVGSTVPVIQLWGKYEADLLTSLLFALAGNMLPDFLSLFQTRVILGRVKVGQPFLRFIILDFLLTFTIAAVSFFSMYFFGTSLRDGHLNWYALSNGTNVFMPQVLGIRLRDYVGGIRLPMGVLFYSTFFTSVWLWFYVGARTVIRAEEASGSLALFLKRHGFIDTENKPLQALGMISALIVTVLYLAVTILSWVF